MKKYLKRALIVLILIIILAIIRCSSLKNEHISTHSSSSSVTAVPEPESTIQDSEDINKETEELIFGEWEVSKLIGFTKVQNDYTNYPDGHDIIGDHLIINEEKFSSEGLHKYERYQCKITNPIYSLSGIRTKMFRTIFPTKSIEEDSKINDMINNDYLERLSVQDKFHEHASVGLLISSTNHLILEIDGAFYLLDKIQ